MNKKDILYKEEKMADMTDVYVRIKYQKEGKIREEDILEDLELWDAISDMEYQGIDYEIEEKLILCAYGRNYYPSFYEEDSELRRNLFATCREKGIEKLYYYFCDFSYEMERIYWGTMVLDAEQETEETEILKEEDYQEVLESLIKEKDEEFQKDYERFQNGGPEEDEDEEEYEEFYEEFYDTMQEMMKEHMLEKFILFLEEK